MSRIDNRMIKIGIYSGSFNPPGIHHRKIAEKVLEKLDYLILIPCGSKKRKDKTYPDDAIRKRMVKLGFKGINRCYIDNVNLDMGVFMSNYELEERYRKLLGENITFIHIVGSDLTCKYKNGKSKIEHIWMNGEKLWRDSNFMVIPREGCSLEHLPRNCTVIEDFMIDGSSSKIKRDLATTQDILEDVKEYILENEIYGEER